MAEAVTWLAVLEAFADRGDPEAVIHRLAGEWADRFGLLYRPIGSRCRIQQVSWSHIEVGEHLDRLAKIVPEMLTTQMPRRFDGALVVVDFGKGRIGQIDGRRRANFWRHMPGQYNVLVVEA